MKHTNMIILSVQVDDFTYITATCAASQKTLKYNCYVALQSDGTVVSATCECTIG